MPNNNCDVLEFVFCDKTPIKAIEGSIQLDILNKMAATCFLQK